jgi:DNA-binding Xre family transcriptional regulator
MRIIVITCYLSSAFDKFTYQMLHKGEGMLRFRLKELIAEREFRERRVITITEIAAATGVHRMTLSKVANHPDYNVSSDVLDRLCTYFNCAIGDLVEHIPERDTSSSGG